jgi:hypothetical protein
MRPMEKVKSFGAKLQIDLLVYHYVNELLIPPVN